MKINILAPVRCTDGPAGFCSHIIVNSTALRVTYLVVQANLDPQTRKLAALGSVKSTDADGIRLDCTRRELSLMDDFINKIHMTVNIPNYQDKARALIVGGGMPDEGPMMVVMSEENVAPDELVLDSSTRVEATDAPVGLLDALEVEPESGRITGLVMRKGRIGSKSDVAIAAAEIDHLEGKAAFLKLDKQGIAALPVVPLGK